MYQYQTYQNYPQYQPYQMPQNQPMPSQSVQQPQTNAIIWVTSEDAVKNYPIAPGGS